MGSTTQLVTLFTGFIIGMSGGINVLVAMARGEKNSEKTTDTVYGCGDLPTGRCGGYIVWIIFCRIDAAAYEYQTGVNSFDTVTVEGTVAAADADGIIYELMSALYNACSTFISQSFQRTGTICSTYGTGTDWFLFVPFGVDLYCICIFRNDCFPVSVVCILLDVDRPGRNLVFCKII